MLKVVSVSNWIHPKWTGLEQVFVFTGYRFREYISITDCIEVVNSSPSPKDTFSISAGSLLPVVMNLSPAESIIGFGHTHPARCPNPSDEDIAGIDEESFGIVFCGEKAIWYDYQGVIYPKYL